MAQSVFDDREALPEPAIAQALGKTSLAWAELKEKLAWDEEWRLRLFVQRGVVSTGVPPAQPGRAVSSRRGRLRAVAGKGQNRKTFRELTDVAS